MSPSSSPARAKLLWRHFTWQLGVVAAIWSSMALAVSFYQYARQRSFLLHDDFYAPDRAALRDLANNTWWLLLLLLLSGFLLAVVGGLVRQPLLAALS